MNKKALSSEFIFQLFSLVIAVLLVHAVYVTVVTVGTCACYACKVDSCADFCSHPGHADNKRTHRGSFWVGRARKQSASGALPSGITGYTCITGLWTHV